MTIELNQRLQALLDERQTHSVALEAIDGKLSQIEQLLVGGSVAAPKKRGRPAKALAAPAATNGAVLTDKRWTLADHLEGVLKGAGKPLAIADLVAAIKAGSYKTKSKDLRPVVSLALIKDGRFKRVERGIYSM